ncbi:MAG TPA: arylsulfatase [Planctomycetota bacterium]|nr:arylsulfatase [Planctomycetota bacterium]
MAASKSVSPAAASARLWVTILVGLLLGGSASARPPQAEQTRRRPNILVVLADDMGFSDAGCYGGEIQTPTLDELARNGLRFTQFYNTGRCWPSRASLLTGYYAQQVNRDPAGVRPPWARLLPEFLRPLGYRSYHSGKWHVDGKVLAGGFDRSYSIYDHDRNFGPRQHTLDDQPLPAVGPGQGYYSTTAIAEHAIDFLAEHRKAHSDQPFFLYLAFIAPHFPLQAPAEDIAVYQDRYRAGWDALRDERHGRLTKMGLVQCGLSKLDPDIVPSWNLSPQELREKIGPGEVARAIPWKELTEEQQRFQAQKMSIHAAMIHRIDRETRRVLDQIRAMKAFDDTLVLFLSDNGASAEQIIRGDQHDPTAPPGSARSFLCLGPGWSSAANTPFRLHKSWVHEGGVSTPLIVHWPAGIKARGELRHTPGHLVDLLPTLLEITGGKPIETGESQTRPSFPGRSLLPAFASDVPIPHDFIFFQHAGNQGIRLGDFKLVSRGKNPWELYDLRSDRCEMVDLAVQSPEKVADLSSRWKALAEKYRLQGGPPPAKGEDHPDRR